MEPLPLLNIVDSRCGKLNLNLLKVIQVIKKSCYIEKVHHFVTAFKILRDLVNKNTIIDKKTGQS